MTIDNPDETGITHIYPHRRADDLASISETDLARAARAEAIETWSSRLIRARKAMRPKMTQEDLEKESGIKRSLIGAYEKGIVKEPNPDVLAKLCSVLGITVDSLHVEDSGHALPGYARTAPANLDAKGVIREALKRVRALERWLEDWLDESASSD